MSWLRTARVPLTLYVFALLVQGTWAVVGPAPTDWDPSYYRAVASRMAAGEGLEAHSIWMLAWLPDTLPFPADLHWMPLPSRVLVPFLWAWPEHGDRLGSVLLGATVAPLAWATARRLGGEPRTTILAGVLAGFGLMYGWMLSVPDSVALYAVVGGAAFLAVADGRVFAAALLAVLAALTRNDGFLLAPCLALGLRAHRGAWLVALAGPAAAGLWHVRNLMILGQDYQALRAATSGALTLRQLVEGSVSEAGLTERLVVVMRTLPRGLGLLCLAFLPFPAMLVAFLQRRAPWVQAWLVYALLFPIVAFLLAPGVAASGTLFRSGAALFAGACALAAVGMSGFGAWASRRRGYPPSLMPLAGTLMLVVVGSVVGPAAYVNFNQSYTLDCAVLDEVPPGEPVFSSNPLRVEAQCGRPGVVLWDGVAPALAADVGRRYGISHALLDADDSSYTRLLRTDAERVLPGWEEVRPGLLRRPDPVEQE